MRDITLAETIYPKFTTRAFATGIPTTLAGTPVVSAYENDNTTQITAGVTLGVDHDSVTGLNMVTVVATGANGFESGKEYQLVITTGTVGGVSVVGEVVGEFTIDSSAALKAVDLLNDVAATDIVSAGAITTLSGAIVNVDLVDTITTYTGDTPQTGDNFARLGAPAGASVSADIADVPTVSEFNARTLVAASYFDPAADTVANVTTVATTTTNTDMVAEPTTLLTTQMSESYAGAAVAPTLAQALFAIQQFQQDHASAGTTKTVKRLDGSTTAMTLTYDDGSDPNSLSRTT